MFSWGQVTHARLGFFYTLFIDIFRYYYMEITLMLSLIAL